MVRILVARWFQIQFPAWLGKNSKRNKIDRILQELQMHTRLSGGVSKGSLALDYCQVLRDHIVAPLVKDGTEGVDKPDPLRNGNIVIIGLTQLGFDL